MDKKKIVSIASVLMRSTCNLFYDLMSDEEDITEDVIPILEVAGHSYNKNYEKENVVRIMGYMNTISNYTEKQFQQHFRLSLQSYECLLNKIGPALRRSGNIGRNTIDVDKQLLSTLWLLATPDSYRSVADRFDMGKSSLSVSFIRVVEALNEIANTIIAWPTADHLQHVINGFKVMAGLDKVVGAIDGTFVPIKAPKEDSEVYITRKCNYAITLQAVSDCDLKFIDIYVGYPGSVSDSRIFRNSDLYTKVSENYNEMFLDQEFLIGDKAYPLLMWCVPPYIERGALTRAQKNFNEVHAKTRQTIERSFALLFGRFRRLKFLDMNRHDMIPATVLAACVLHNLCLDHQDLFREQYIDEGRNYFNNDEVPLVDELAVENNQQAKTKRDYICNELYYRN